MSLNRRALLALSSAACLPGLARAQQGWPVRPLRIVVPSRRPAPPTCWPARWRPSCRRRWASR